MEIFALNATTCLRDGLATVIYAVDDGDGRSDLVGRGGNGVHVSLSRILARYLACTRSNCGLSWTSFGENN